MTKFIFWSCTILVLISCYPPVCDQEVVITCNDNDSTCLTKTVKQNEECLNEW